MNFFHRKIGFEMLALVVFFATDLFAGARVGLGAAFYHAVLRQHKQKTMEMQPVAALTGNFSHVGEFWGGEMEFVLARAAKQRFYLGENSFLYLGNSRLRLLVGKKKIPFVDLIFPTASDGMEGIALQLGDETFRATVVLADYYSGFTLYEYDRFRPENKTVDGYRTRHGLSLEKKIANWSLGARMQYLSMGNWGYYSRDRKEGDGDYLYHAGVFLGYAAGNYKTGLLADMSRGEDRILYNRNQKTDRIPFNGELFAFFLSWSGKWLSVGEKIYLPDADKKDEAGNLLAYGYTSSGNRPFENTLLAVTLDVYPSAWIGRNGLEKNDSIPGARRSLFYSVMETEIPFRLVKLFCKWHYLLPYADEKRNGTAGTNRRDFSKSFLAELSLGITASNDAYFLSVDIAHVFSSKDLEISADGILFAAGLWF